MWAVILGDAVHNLRSALDHLIWQLVLLDTGKDGSNEHQFPVASSGERRILEHRQGRWSEHARHAVARYLG